MLLFLPGQFTSFDFLLIPFYVGLIFLIASFFKPESKFLKYYYRGLLMKIIGGVVFWLIHCLLYKGGDSWAYFYSAKAISKLMLINFNDAWSIISGEVNGIEIMPYFNSYTGTPASYMTKDFHTFTVARYSSLLSLISFDSFLITTIVLASISYVGLWKLYSLIVKIYPEMLKPGFYLILAMPSLIFWGGGIMKDTYVLSASCWFCYNFYLVDI